MNDLNYQSYCEEGCPDNCCTLVEFTGELDAALRMETFELLQSSSSNCCGSSRTGSGALSSSNHSAISNSHSFDFVGMNSSTVVATRSLCGEGMNFRTALTMNDIHSESSIDLYNVVPAQGDCCEGIYNRQTFIEENNFGMDKNKIEDCTENKSPSNAGQTSHQSVIENIDVCECAYREEGGEGHNKSATRSESLDVAHLVIFSRNEGRVA